jgi:predicted Zn-dependent peptidase
MVDVGAKSEDRQHKGISHFVEHMLFKGNDKLSAKEISYEIERYGADLNAFTDWECTCYWSQVYNKYQDKVYKMLEEFVCNPGFPAKETEKEREVIRQEIYRGNDNPSDKVYDLLNKELFTKSSGLYESIIGDHDTINRTDDKKLKEYYNSYYNSLTLITIGKVPYTFSREGRILRDVQSDTAFLNSNREKITLIPDKVEQAHVLISNLVHLPFNTEQRLFGVQLLQEVYNDMSGRLFQVIREQNNLVYNVHFIYQYFTNGDIQWFVSLGLDAKNIIKAHDLIIRELEKPITKKDIEYAVNKRLGAFNLLSTMGYATNVAYWFRYGLDINFNYEQTIRKVAKMLPDIQKEMNFNNNILVGLVPKGQYEK